MRAGKLRHLVTVQERGLDKTAGGERQEETWIDVSDPLFADVRPATAKEMMVADQQSMVISHKVTIRFIPDLFKSDRRICFNGRSLQITGARDFDERGIMVLIDCLEDTDG